MKQTGLPKQDLKTTESPSNTLLHQIQSQLAPYSDSPYLDALVLLSSVSGKSKAAILAHPSPLLTADQQVQLSAGIKQIQQGVPLPYVLQRWEFFQLSFWITPDVLIPRPETEGLVERALGWFQKSPGQRRCLDLGTGSGCIAISLAYNLPDLQVIATDISYPALLVARENACRMGVQDRVSFLAADLLSGIHTGVGLLIANLPYIPTEKLKALRVYQTEPHLALDGGQDGLYLIRAALERASTAVNPGGRILLELDESRGKAAQVMARELFPDAVVILEQDLSKQDRYLEIQLP